MEQRAFREYLFPRKGLSLSNYILVAFISGTFSVNSPLGDRISTERLFASADDEAVVSVVESDQMASFASSGSTLQPILKAADDSMLVLFGTLILPSGRALSTSESFESEFLTSFRDDASALLLKCEGTFVFAFYDAKRKSLSLASDSFGSLALFYHEADDGIRFSSIQRSVARSVGAEVNEVAVSQFVGFKQVLGAGSFYDGVKRVPNASLITWNERANKIQSRYYIPSYDPSPQGALPELLSVIEQNLLSNVEHILANSSSLGAALTGGFDSRIMLGLLRGLGVERNIEFYTHGLPGANDIVVASQIASSFGLRHHILSFDDTLMADAATRLSYTIERSEGGMGIGDAPIICSLIEEAKHFETIIDSHGGAMYRRQFLRVQLPSIRGGTGIPDIVLERMQSPLLHSAFVTAAAREEAQSNTSNALAEYFANLPESLSTEEKIDLFYLDERSGGKVSLAGNLELGHLRFAHPLLSIGVLKQVSSVPLRDRRRNLIYLALMDRLLPEAKKFPLDNSGYLIKYRGFRWRRYLPKIYDIILHRLVGPNYQKLSPRKWLMTNSAIVSNFRNEIGAILTRENSPLSEYVDIALLRQAFKSQQIVDPELIALTNFALLLEYLAG